jgi:hypothetical protein
VRLRPLIVPQEHGVYPLWAEPVLLGLLLAPSLAGVAIAVAGAAGVLAQQPAALALADLRRGRRYPRTRVAASAAAALAVAGVLLLAFAVGAAPAPFGADAWWAALALAAAPAAVQLAEDRRFRGKSLLAQAAGAVALAGLATAVALAGGAPPALAWSAWVALALRVAASIPATRTRLRRARGRAPDVAPALIGAALLPAAAAWAAWTGWASPLVAAVAVAVGLRAAWASRPDAKAVTPTRIGVGETVVGLLWVAVLAAGGLTGGPA